MVKTLFISFSFLLSFSSLNAQKMESYRWKNRLILLISEDSSNTQYQKQLAALQKEISGLEERKLLVYHILPTAYRSGISNNINWIADKSLYQKYKTHKEAFEFHLIGLDGGTKLLENSFVSVERLFSTIDAMPMRRAEMRRKNQ